MSSSQIFRLIQLPFDGWTVILQFLSLSLEHSSHSTFLKSCSLRKLVTCVVLVDYFQPFLDYLGLFTCSFVILKLWFIKDYWNSHTKFHQIVICGNTEFPRKRQFLNNCWATYSSKNDTFVFTRRRAKTSNIIGECSTLEQLDEFIESNESLNTLSWCCSFVNHLWVSLERLQCTWRGLTHAGWSLRLRERFYCWAFCNLDRRFLLLSVVKERELLDLGSLSYFVYRVQLSPNRKQNSLLTVALF